MIPVTEPISLEEIQAARSRIDGHITRTPLVRLNVDDVQPEIYLKLENLQPIGAFKIRGAVNAMAKAGPEALEAGVWTASAGNMAQGVAWNARRLGVQCTVVVPDHAPDAKLEPLERQGATVVKVPFEQWWNIIVTHQHEDQAGLFVHPVSGRAVMAGNATIGLELAEDLDDFDAVVVPYGGGGLSSGIASALRAVRPDAKVFAAEVSTGAPLHAAFEAGEPVDVDHESSYVDGIGSGRVLDEMWTLVNRLLTGSIVASLDEVSEAIRLLAVRNRVVAEGAGAASVAAALTGGAGRGKVVCIVSGGNINIDKFCGLLSS